MNLSKHLTRAQRERLRECEAVTIGSGKKPAGSFQCLENRCAGFSLLEVLVALAIFGIAAGGVLVALGHHLKNVSFLQDHERAVRIASREINVLRRMTDFEESETEGSEERFSWTSQVTTTGLDDWPGLDEAPGTPALLSVTVQWSDSEGGTPLGKVHLDGFDVFGAEK